MSNRYTYIWSRSYTKFLSKPELLQLLFEKVNATRRSSTSIHGRKLNSSIVKIKKRKQSRKDLEWNLDQSLVYLIEISRSIRTCLSIPPTHTNRSFLSTTRAIRFRLQPHRVNAQNSGIIYTLMGNVYLIVWRNEPTESVIHY